LANTLANSLGCYGFPAESSILFRDELALSEEVFQNVRPLEQGIVLLDRQITGQDWMRGPMQRRTKNSRIVFHGIKGGVGRSTALTNWAWHLAEQGKKVMVIDLDLESPGLGSTMLPLDHAPDFGIVDWFVEDGVGQGDSILPEMVTKSPLASRSPGDILVVPAYGAKTSEYLAKLSRCYADLSNDGPGSWAARLNRMVEALENEHCPDAILFDSRAGIHDIAATLLTRMDAEVLLFAVDSHQTWDGYGLLFRHWKSNPQLLTAFRERLQIVASMVPETGRDNYLEGFKEQAWDLFRENLYDEIGADDVDGFSYDLEEAQAPHDPLPIFWARALQEFNPLVGGIDTATAESAFRLFFKRADAIIPQASR